MKKAVQELKIKMLSLEEVFNLSFDILKLNLNRIILPIIILIVIKLAASLLLRNEIDFYSRFITILYNLISYFIIAVINANLNIEISGFVESKNMDSLLRLKQEILIKVFFYSLVCFTLIFLAGIISGIFIIIISAIFYFFPESISFISFSSFIILSILLLFLDVKLSFLKSIYYIRDLGVEVSIRYSFHTTKNYFKKLLITKLIFFYLISMLGLLIIFSSFLTLASESFWILILSLILQVIIYFFIAYLSIIKNSIITLFYLNAENLDLKNSEKSNKTIE